MKRHQCKCENSSIKWVEEADFASGGVENLLLGEIIISISTLLFFSMNAIPDIFSAIIVGMFISFCIASGIFLLSRVLEVRVVKYMVIE